MSRAAYVIALATALTACNAPHGPRFRAAGRTTPYIGGTLHIASKDQIHTLDPAIAYDEASSYATHALFDTLLDYAPAVAGDDRAAYALIPRLAERWDLSADARRLSFTLRPGLRYADGLPITTADIVYSLERALRTVDSPFGPFLADVDGADEVVAGKASHVRGLRIVSDRELVIELVRPNVAFPYVLTMAFSTPQRADYVAKVGDDLRRAPLATGPYVLAAWTEGTELVLRRNPNYWDPQRGRIETIELRENVARDTQFLMFERGELDTIEHLATPDYLWITSEPEWAPTTLRFTPLTVYGSRMNVRRPPFDDVRVRRALNYAADKDHMIKLLHGTAVVAHGALPPGVLGRDDTLAPYPHDPAKARALLREAGYGPGHALALRYTTLNDEEAQQLAGSLQDDLAEVGVALVIETMSLATFATADTKLDGPAFALESWIGDFPDPSNFFEPRLHSRMITPDGSTNDAFYANPELDRILDAARATADPSTRAALYRTAERMVFDDAPWIFGYHQQSIEVTQPYVRDYAPHPVWVRDYSAAWLDLNPDDERQLR